jgi:16S rRNA (adenine1518-N6/adenine1519-N6)-dimethyltransferase
MTAPRPKKRFGQHFLHDRAIVARIIDAFHPSDTDHVAEIGPGPGVLTRELATRVRRFVAVEVDRDLAAALTQEFADIGSVAIHEADALKFDFCQLCDDGEPLRLIGNLPYNISTPLLFHLFSQLHCVKDMLFMLQKEVVDRLCAVPDNKDYGRLSVMAQVQCRIERCFNVGPGAFQPPPKVDSAIVRLVPHETPPVDIKNAECFRRLVKAAFAQRRKTLRNTLKEFLDAETMEAHGIDPGRRAETLSVAEFATLANAACQY